MRHPADDLAGHLTTAINAAFHDFRAKARTSDTVAPALLAERFADFHDQAVRAMGAITQAITGAMEQLRASTGVRGDPSPRGLEHVLEQTRGVVDAMRGADENDQEEIHGTGRAADGRVRVDVAPGGPVTSLEIDQRAIRAGSQALAGHVAEAVNTALDDLQTRSYERTRAARVNPETLHALREASTEQMAAYTRSLRAITAGTHCRRGPGVTAIRRTRRGRYPGSAAGGPPDAEAGRDVACVHVRGEGGVPGMTVETAPAFRRDFLRCSSGLA